MQRTNAANLRIIHGHSIAGYSMFPFPINLLFTAIVYCFIHWVTHIFLRMTKKRMKQYMMSHQLTIFFNFNFVFLMKHLRTCHHSVWLSYCHRNLKTNHISCSMLCYRERMSLIFFKFDITIVLFVMPTNNHANHFMVTQFGEQGWHSGECARLPEMWSLIRFRPVVICDILVFRILHKKNNKFQFKDDRRPAWKPTKANGVTSSLNIAHFTAVKIFYKHALLLVLPHYDFNLKKNSHDTLNVLLPAANFI